MAMSVIGAGVGRTGTYSLKLALEHLGLGPCHHMEEVINDPPRHVPLWAAAVAERPDWAAAYEGYNSAVDWPTAGFFRELASAYPQARFILTVRSPESWVESFSQTIFKLLAGRDNAPPPMRPLLAMGAGVVGKCGFAATMSRDELGKAFTAHAQAVTSAIPADRLLVYEVKQGWAPLCAFLSKPIPADPFPKTNNKEDFWDRFK